MPIDYEKRDGVAYITLNNPEKANILDKPTSDDISAAGLIYGKIGKFVVQSLQARG